MIKSARVEDVPRKMRRTIPNKDVIEFLKSDCDIAEVDLAPYENNVASAWSSYYAAVRRRGGCRLIMRNKRLFLVKEGVKC